METLVPLKSPETRSHTLGEFNNDIRNRLASGAIDDDFLLKIESPPRHSRKDVDSLRNFMNELFVSALNAELRAAVQNPSLEAKRHADNAAAVCAHYGLALKSGVPTSNSTQKVPADVFKASQIIATHNHAEINGNQSLSNAVAQVSYKAFGAAPYQLAISTQTSRTPEAITGIRRFAERSTLGVGFVVGSVAVGAVVAPPTAASQMNIYEIETPVDTFATGVIKLEVPEAATARTINLSTDEEEKPRVISLVPSDTVELPKLVGPKEPIEGAPEPQKRQIQLRPAPEEPTLDMITQPVVSKPEEIASPENKPTEQPNGNGTSEQLELPFDVPERRSIVLTPSEDETYVTAQKKESTEQVLDKDEDEEVESVSSGETAPGQVPASEPIPLPEVAPVPEVAPAPEEIVEVPTPTPEVIIDPSLASETMWTEGQLEIIQANLPVYMEVQHETGVPWEMQVAIHMRESSLRMDNPPNGQGIYQMYSMAGQFAPGPVSVEDFKRQTFIMAEHVLEKAADHRRVSGPLDMSNPDKIKDALFGYNGVADPYIQQAIDMGYDLWAEGSPYVMNMMDDQRNSNINPNWGQILTDNGPLGKANQAPGAWPLIEGLVHINKVAHEHLAAEEAERVVAERKAAEEEAARVTAKQEATRVATEQAKAEVEPEPAPFSVQPIEGLGVNSDFGPRGNGGFHAGIDYPAGIGEVFIATVSGQVSIHETNVENTQWCADALNSFGLGWEVLSDPIGKEVHITTTIDGDVYTVIYAHLNKYLVNDGDTVTLGQPVGETGDTGCSTAPHAHYEIRKNGVPINPADVHGDTMKLLGVIDMEVLPASPSIDNTNDELTTETKKAAAPELLHKHIKKVANTQARKSKIDVEARLRAQQAQKRAQQQSTAEQK